MRVLLCAALALAGCSHDSAEFPLVLDTTPFETQTEGRIETDVARDTVDTLTPTTLRWTSPGATSFAWVLTGPPGSTAALDDPAAAQPSFTPDMDGRYTVTAMVGLSDGTVAMETRRITAATDIGSGACASCHVVPAMEVFPTDHTNCESCHGPGSGHNADPRNIANSLRAGVCSACHDPEFTEWGNSSHAEAPPSFVLARADCQRCHTGRGFNRAVRGQAFQPDPPGAVGAACAACHDPHSDARAPHLRLFGNVKLTSGGEYNFGRGAACGTCHQSTVADPVAHTATSHRFTFAVQADMIAKRGGVGYGQSYASSFHATTVMRLRTFTGSSDDSNTPDSCVICHMAPSAASPLPDRMGGHALAMRMSNLEYAAGNCDRCHPGLTTFDRNIGKDFDGDGVALGVQTEVRRLMEILFQALRQADAGNALTRPGGANTQAFVDADLSKSTPQLRQAVWNYNFNALDGSAGIHNTKYAVRLLQTTYTEVTGRSFFSDFPLAVAP